MTEKQYCGQCTHLSRKGIKEGLPQLYCSIIGKEVSFVGFTCPEFEKRVVPVTIYEIDEFIKRSYQNDL